MHQPYLPEEVVESAIERMAASEGEYRSVYCHGCRRWSEVPDAGVPLCPLCCSDQIDFSDAA